jgi:hypothetical protein
LRTKHFEKKGIAKKRRTVVDVLVRLNNPDEFLDRVVEVEFDLIGRRSNRFITSELELLNEVLVRILSHFSAFIGIKEDIVDVERSSNKGLLVGHGNRLGSTADGRSERLDSPETLTNGAEINVDFHLVVLECNTGKGKSRVAAKPEEERNVKGGLRKSIARSANLGRSTVR